LNADRTWHFRLPPRYREEWGGEFWECVGTELRRGATVLDVGAGRRPTISLEERPVDVYYVGLDESPGELDASEPGSYDEKVVGDAQVLIPELTGRFDLIVAWQVLEHFSDLPRAAAAFYEYAKPGGLFVSMLSGRYAAFSIANRILPQAVSRRLVAHLMRRPAETVFPAFYDHAYERGLRAAFAGWDELRVVPLWRGGDYFARLPGLRWLYLRYEDWTIRHHHTNLATHYMVAARKHRIT
jgi:SAM-dependent methyltransferase